ncbi:MAG: leucine-rich repeat domain-containing protein [Chitinophagaceae bacterium]
MEKQTFVFKNSGGTEMNDVFMPTPSLELPNYSYQIIVSPKTNFWRLGLRFSKTADIQFNSAGRYVNFDLKDLQIAAGKMMDKGEWLSANVLELGSSYIADEGSNQVFDKWDTYKSESNVELNVKEGSKLNTLYYSFKAEGCPEIKNEIYFPQEYRYFKIFAWADYVNFELECVINSDKQLPLRLIEENRNTKNIKLDLSKCGMHEIPAGISELHWLEELVIGTSSYYDYIKRRYVRTANAAPENDFDYMPSGLNNLVKLKTLVIIMAKPRLIKSFDLREFAQLYNLEFLCITSSGISDITPLQNLHKIEQLYLYDNNITNIQPLASLKKLRALRFRGNKVSDISALSGLVELEVLRFGKNQVRDIGSLLNLTKLTNLSFYSNLVSDITALSGLSKLSKLMFKNNRVTNIGSIRNLTELEILDFGSNKVEDILPLAGLSKLKKISFRKNNVTNLVSLFGKIALEELSFSDNKINDISYLAGLENLSNLDCSSNQIDNLSALAGLKKLNKLIIKKNPITEIDTLCLLPELKELDFSHSAVSDISPLREMETLQKVDFENCPVKKIEPLFFLPSLLKFYSNYCPIEDCPSIVYESGDPQQLQAYFKAKSLPGLPSEDGQNSEKKSSQDSVSQENYYMSRRDVRLFILGNSNTGKTNLVHYLETGEFLGDRKSTHGLEVHRWEPDSSRFPSLDGITVSIWDFGGQEYYHEAYKLFLTSNAVYLVIWCTEYDTNGRVEMRLNDKGPIVELEHFELRYWLDTIHYYTQRWKNVSLFTAQNKVDGKSTMKRIDQKIHDRYFINNSFNFSLKEGYDKKNILYYSRLQYFLKELENEIFTHTDKAPIPFNWQKIRNWLLNLQSIGNPFLPFVKADLFISIPDFISVCKELMDRPLTENDIYTIPRWLHQSGVVQYYPEINTMNNRLFIPDLLAKSIYQVLSVDVLDRGGDFSKNDITSISDQDTKDLLLEVAKQLGIIFQHPVKDKDHFIAFQYLPETHIVEDLFRIAEKGISKSSFKIKVPLFYYKRVLHAVLLHFASDKSIERRYFWKHGILFIKDQQVALIQGIYPKKDEQDAIIVLGVEANVQKGNYLQKEIFNVLLEKLATGINGKNIPNLEGEVSENIDAENETFESASSSLDNSEIMLSTDGINYVSYSDLIENPEEIKIKANTGVQLFTRQFEPLLPFNFPRAKKVFLSYSHRDTKWFERLRVHLTGLEMSGVIESWDDKKIEAGDLWDDRIKKKMEDADVYVLLLSADFLASKYIWNYELSTAMENFIGRHSTIIPILLEPFDITGIPKILKSGDGLGYKIGDFEIIPKTDLGQLMAVSQWKNTEEAMEKITARIREVLTSE